MVTVSELKERYQKARNFALINWLVKDLVNEAMKPSELIRVVTHKCEAHQLEMGLCDDLQTIIIEIVVHHFPKEVTKKSAEELIDEILS